MQSGPPIVARQNFINAMRVVASSVTVVTTDGIAGCHGATVSAFSSVSADPPTTLICLRAHSRIAEAVERNGVYCVNVLPQSGRLIAERFAGHHDQQFANRFEGIELREAQGAPPVIIGATAFSCVVEQVVTSGSHKIFIGHVNDLQEGSPGPLTYLSGAYHRVVPQDAIVNDPKISGVDRDERRPSL